MSDLRTQAQPAQGQGEAEDQLRLSLHLCHTLQNASRAFGSVYRQLLRDVGLTYPQYLVMLALWEHGELTVKSLGRLLRLDSGTLSPLLKRLATLDLVSRERGATDERSVVVRLTDAGEALRTPAAKVPEGIQAAAGMSEEDVATLQTLLQRLTASLDAAAETH